MRKTQVKAWVRLCVVAVTLMALLPAPTVAAEKKASNNKESQTDAIPDMTQRPWTLRDHYKFRLGKSVLWYGVENSEWRLVVDGLDTVADNVTFRIRLADGTVIDAPALGTAESNRERFSDSLGTGTIYWTEYPAHNGIAVRHCVRTLDRPLLLVSVEIGNVGDKPIEVTSIEPVVLGPAGIRKPSPQATVENRTFTLRGGFAVHDPETTSLVLFTDLQKAFTLALGILPTGIARPKIIIRDTPDAWYGGVVCKYEPSVTLAPGEKLRSDDVCVMAGMSDVEKMITYYSWAMSVLPHPQTSKALPSTWVTQPDGTPLAEVCEAANAWNSAGVHHALIPWAWEGRPGSYDGASPNYPSNMSKAADQLKATGAMAGLTVDPLLTSNGGAGTATSADGRHWANLSMSEGRSVAAENMRKAVRWGFDFFVVKLSDIPPDVLRKFNMTRAQADNLALAIMTEAAGQRPVLPSTLGSIEANPADWAATANWFNQMAEYKVQPGPARLDAENVKAAGDELAGAMALFQGSIEMVGQPSGGAERVIAKLR